MSRYSDDQLRQRRMDYSPDVTGNPPVAHYTHDPQTFDGFVFPTRLRRAVVEGRKAGRPLSRSRAEP